MLPALFPLILTTAIWTDVIFPVFSEEKMKLFNLPFHPKGAELGFDCSLQPAFSDMWKAWEILRTRTVGFVCLLGSVVRAKNNSPADLLYLLHELFTILARRGIAICLSVYYH